jgi:hypothetical protein
MLSCRSKLSNLHTVSGSRDWSHSFSICRDVDGCPRRRWRQTPSVSPPNLAAVYCLRTTTQRRLCSRCWCVSACNYVPQQCLVLHFAAFLSFSMIQFRDGPYVRPHPAFWRIILGINLLYELALVFLLFQDLPNARLMMKALDPSLGVPLAEKSYADDCSFTPTTLWVSFFTIIEPQTPMMVSH